jgi:hypothetical protein
VARHRPAHERDFDGADLDQARSQLTTRVHRAGPLLAGPMRSLLAVTHAFVIGRFVQSAMDATPID